MSGLLDMALSPQVVVEGSTPQRGSKEKILRRSSTPRLGGSWISPSKKEGERRRKGEKRGGKKK
jgi:hypothetical protein